MFWIILVLVSAPITLPLTARLALGEDDAEVAVAALIFGVFLAILGARLAYGGAL